MSQPGGASPTLPPLRTGVSNARRWIAIAVAVVALPLLTALLQALRPEMSLGSVLLIYLLAVVVISAIGGAFAAFVAAVASFFLANWFFTEPLHSLQVTNRDAIIELIVFIVVALTVSLVADISAKRRITAQRSEIEAALLAAFSSAPVAQATDDVLRSIARLFAMDSVALVDLPNDVELARVGESSETVPVIVAAAGEGLELRAYGQPVFGEDSRLLNTLAQAAGRAAVTQRLSEEAAHAEVLIEIDRTRTALLAAVSHDLRTPLTRIKAAASALRQGLAALDTEQSVELLTTIEEGTDTLTMLIANLLDMGRLEAGALSVDIAPMSVDEPVAAALIAGDFHSVINDVPDNLALVLADAGLLERVLANLIDNAVRYSPHAKPTRITARRCERNRIAIDVVDHGPGIPTSELEPLFTPFHQRGDTVPHSGAGLGLSIARGFTTAMGGELLVGPTAGGGLTISVILPIAAPAE